MKKCLSFFIAVLGVVWIVSLSGSVGSQESPGKPTLAPGVLITIPPDVDYAATKTVASMVDILPDLPRVSPELAALYPELAHDPRLNPDIWARDVRFTRDIWCLQFSFKPVRMVEVDIPNSEGSFDKKMVWYLVYNIKNVGPAEIEKSEKALPGKSRDNSIVSEITEYQIKTPGSVATGVTEQKTVPIQNDTIATTPDSPGFSENQTRDANLVLQNKEGAYGPQPGKASAIKPALQFILAADGVVVKSESTVNPETGKLDTNVVRTSEVYLDQVIPIAIPTIMRREGMKEIPKTTVSICREELGPGDDVWGLAMWTDVNPRINHFSIYVSGLTNAYRWKDKDPMEEKSMPGEGRSIERKVLKTDWIRPGDSYNLSDRSIQFVRPTHEEVDRVGNLPKGENDKAGVDDIWIFR